MTPGPAERAADPLFLGIDGGGSGCRARLETADRRLLGEGRAGPASLRLGAERAFDAVLAAARGALAQGGVPAEDWAGRVHAFAGLAGASRVGARAALAKQSHPFASLGFGWDVETACVGAHRGADGGIVVVGTGSCAFARLGERRLRFGGYGLPASDEGSGSSIGVQAMARALMHLDGRVPASPLFEDIFALVPSSAAEAVAWMDESGPAGFAALAPIVLAHAEGGEPNAIAILDEAVAGIAGLVRALVDAGVGRVALTGGLAPAIGRRLPDDLRAHLSPPFGDPLSGALILAGQPLASHGPARLVREPKQQGETMSFEPIWAVGLMTGTVLDGNVDVAMIRTDGETIAEFGPWALKPYPQPVRDLIGAAVAAAREWRFEGREPPIFAEAERALSAAQADAVADFLREHALAPETIGVVGLHGQTVLHRAPVAGRLGATRQLGDGALMADRLGIPVAFDFRSADVAAGGQGAPLAPIYHRALLARLDDDLAGPRDAILNLGGVGNLTFADRDGRLVAFDTGPANGPVNDWVRRLTGAEMDRNGALAMAGRPDEAVIARHLAHPYFVAPPPKSLDRYDFTAAMADGLGLEDGAATLTHFAASAVARGLDRLPTRPGRLVVCGGGRHNPALMAALEARTGLAVVAADALGLRGDAVEAECFAFLAVRSLRGLPISYPSTTGAPRPMTGGRLARPRQSAKDTP